MNVLTLYAPFRFLVGSQASGEQALFVLESTPVAGEKNKSDIAWLHAVEKTFIHFFHFKNVAVCHEENLCTQFLHDFPHGLGVSFWVFQLVQHGVIRYSTNKHTQLRAWTCRLEMVIGVLDGISGAMATVETV